MKILQLVTKRQYRGAEVFAANLSKELIDLGHEIIFAGLYKNDENELTVRGAKNIDLTESKQGRFSLKLIRDLISLIKTEDPDVIQCNGSDTLKYMYAASFGSKKKPIVYRNISTISEWLNSSVKLKIYKKIFSKVDHVSSVGSESIQDLINTFNYPEYQTSVIRRGIPNDKISESQIAIDLKKELKISGNCKIVMHVGNFSPEKNHLFLLDIFEQLKIEDPTIKLVCVGDGVTFSNIQTQIKDRNLDDTIYLLGFQKNIPHLIANADIIILVSLVEGVPGVILEGAVQEKPAIASNVGGVKEVLINEETGIIINNFEKRQYINAISKLCKEDDLRDQLGTNARNLVVEQFNPRYNALKFEKLYAQLSGKTLVQDEVKKDLRILQIIQKKQYRGAEIFCCQLSNELEKNNHEVKVFSIYEGDAELPFIKPIDSLQRNQRLRYSDYFGWKALADIVRQFNPDIIQANASDTLKYSVFSRQIFGWKVPIIFRNASLTSYYINSKISLKLNQYLFRNVDAIISVSESSKKDLNALFPFTESKSNVITNGVSDIDSDEIENPYQADTLNIVHVGSLTEEKNHLELLEIFKMFLKTYDKSHLHIIGEGYLKREIEKKIIDLSLANNVTVHGEKNNPGSYIKNADMLVLPSLVEGLPGVILEAMNQKTYVIAYDVGGISEIINENTGFLIDQNDKLKFVEAMNIAAEDKDRAKLLEAKRLVDSTFKNEILANKFVTTYKNVISTFKQSNLNE